jgi:plastocyanin
MRRYTARTALLSVSVCLAACGIKPGAPKKAEEERKAVAYFHVDPATAGSVSGKITYEGPKPAKTAISMTSDADCEKLHAGHPVYDESVVVGPAHGLANAFVYVKSGLEGKRFELPQQPVVLDQRACMYVPRVIGIRVGQTMDVRNSDPVSHNIHPIPENNREWNQQQSPQAPNLQHRFPRPEIMVPVKCNVHRWMRAYIGVVDHPYFAVTAPDGAFELENLPPGDYTIAVWHEKFGEKTAAVHVAATQATAVSFTYR